MRRVGAGEQRVAVGRRLRHEGGRDAAVRALPVVDHDVLRRALLPSGWPMMRVTMSVPLPGPNGTMMVIGRLGQLCAGAASGIAAAPHRAADQGDEIATPQAHRPASSQYWAGLQRTVPGSR